MILEIFGEIGFWPNTLEAVKERTAGQTIERVDIFSPGGEVFEGLAIAEYVRGLKVPTRGVGFVGSIATAVLLAGEEVTVTEDTILFVHRPAFDAAFYPDAADLERMQAQLEAIEEVLVSIYARRLRDYAGGEEEAKAMAAKFMEEQRFFTAKEAQEIGFVDKVEPAAKIENSNKMALRAVANFRDMNLLDKIKSKLAGIIDDTPTNTAAQADNDNGAAVPDAANPEPATAAEPEPEPVAATEPTPADNPQEDALAAILEKLAAFEKTVAEVRERIERKEERIEELAQATELISEAVARHLGKPMNGATKTQPKTGGASPFDAIAVAFKK